MRNDTRPNVLPFAPVATATLQFESSDELETFTRVQFKRAIFARGWTLEHVARRCFVHTTTVARWISGESRIPLEAWFAVVGGLVANDREVA